MFNQHRLQFFRIRCAHLEHLVNELADVCRATGVDIPPIIPQPRSVTITKIGTVYESCPPTDYTPIEDAIKQFKEKERIKHMVRDEMRAVHVGGDERRHIICVCPDCTADRARGD